MGGTANPSQMMPSRRGDIATIMTGIRNQGIPHAPSAFAAAQNPMRMPVPQQGAPPGSKAPLPPLLSDTMPRTQQPQGLPADFVNPFAPQPAPQPDPTVAQPPAQQTPGSPFNYPPVDPYGGGFPSPGGL